MAWAQVCSLLLLALTPQEPELEAPAAQDFVYPLGAL
jgi:hypothetical protein